MIEEFFNEKYFLVMVITFFYHPPEIK